MEAEKDVSKEKMMSERDRKRVRKDDMVVMTVGL